MVLVYVVIHALYTNFMYLELTRLPPLQRMVPLHVSDDLPAGWLRNSIDPSIVIAIGVVERARALLDHSKDFRGLCDLQIHEHDEL